jgi:uncharacterized UPF0160 family protein
MTNNDNEQTNKEMRAVTHSGNLHADDVFASAVLRIVYPGIEIQRTRNQEEIDSADIVFDVGQVYDTENKRFDHHQTGGAGERENGIPYAAFGLVWKEYGEKICGTREAAEIIDYKIAMPIDAIDNGVDICHPNDFHVMPYSIQQVFSAFIPDWSQDEDLDDVFKKLSDLALTILKKEIAHAQSFIHAKERVQAIYEKTDDKRILIFDAQYPPSILKDYTEAVYIIYPGSSGTDWRVKGVRESADSFDLKKPLPAEWAGKSDKELQDVTGINTATFAHHKRFLVGAIEKEDAIKLANLALSA